MAILSGVRWYFLVVLICSLKVSRWTEWPLCPTISLVQPVILPVNCQWCCNYFFKCPPLPVDAVFLEGSILLIISNVKHVFMSHLAIFMSPLDIWLFRSPAHLLIGLFFLCRAAWVACTFWKWILCVSCFICCCFLPFWGLSFHLVYDFLCYAKAFKFN